MQKHRAINFWLTGVFLLIASVVSFAQVKIGNNPTTLTPSAILEMETTNRGLLLPRLLLTATNNPAMGSSTNNAVQGMTVYNTNANITGTASYPANGVGVYTFDGTGWVYGGIPTGGTTGQVLSKTATGVTWGNPVGGVSTYTATGSSASGAGALVKASGPGVTFSVSTSTQTATITVPAGVEIISARIYDNAATDKDGSYGMTGTNNFLKVKFVFGDGSLSTNYTNAPIPQVQVLVDGVDNPIFTDTYGNGYPRKYTLEAIPASNSFTVRVQLMDPSSLGSKWVVLMNF